MQSHETEYGETYPMGIERVVPYTTDPESNPHHMMIERVLPATPQEISTSIHDTSMGRSTILAALLQGATMHQTDVMVQRTVLNAICHLAAQLGKAHHL